MSTSQPSPPSGQVPAFTVTRQDHQPDYNPNNPAAGTWTVYFTTPSGVESFITVPDDQYTPENVGGLIAARAATIEAVHKLGGA